MKYGFGEQFEVSKYGEFIVVRLFAKHLLKYKQFSCLNDIVGIKDVRNIEEYRVMDIDFLMVTSKGRIYSIEVKTDYCELNGRRNIFAEKESSLKDKKNKGKKGWLLATKADFVFYFCATTKQLFVLKMPDFREFCIKHNANFETATVDNITKDGWYTTLGYKVPKAYMRKYFSCYEEFDLSTKEYASIFEELDKKHPEYMTKLRKKYKFLDNVLDEEELDVDKYLADLRDNNNVNGIPFKGIEILEDRKSVA